MSTWPYKVAILFVYLVLLTSIVGKIHSPDVLTEWVLSIFPKYSVHQHMLKMFSFAVILIEIGVFLSLQKKTGLILNLCLALIFLTINVLIIALDLNTNCGCFGDLVSFPTTSSKMAFLFAYLIASVYCIFELYRNPKTPQNN